MINCNLCKMHETRKPRTMIVVNKPIFCTKPRLFHNTRKETYYAGFPSFLPFYIRNVYVMSINNHYNILFYFILPLLAKHEQLWLFIVDNG